MTSTVPACDGPFADRSCVQLATMTVQRTQAFAHIGFRHERRRGIRENLFGLRFCTAAHKHSGIAGPPRPSPRHLQITVLLPTESAATIDDPLVADRDAVVLGNGTITTNSCTFARDHRLPMITGKP